MNGDVKLALEDLQRTFPNANIISQDDDKGGVTVLVEGVELGEPYTAQSTWFGFDIPFNYPFADIYPHFTAPDLQRSDGKSLDGISGISHGHDFYGKSAMQLSRRSQKSQHPTNASTKLLSVIKWLLTI